MAIDLCSSTHPVWVWALFVLFVMILLWLDLNVFHRKSKAVGIKEALMWAFIWFLLAMAFNLAVWLKCGSTMGLQFFTGYIIEKSLSIDNLFIILLIFTSFQIPAKHQHRVLFWGILGALVMRGLLIIVGAALVSRFDWMFYIFGAFLVWTGAKMFKDSEETYNPHESFAVRMLKRIVPVSKKVANQGFFVKEKGKTAVTLLFVSLVVVEFTDVVFAFDSIPAIFAITTDPFIVFTSNVFAILGLRSLYFVIARAHDLFAHLKTGLAIILIFIGAKLLIKHWVEIPIFLSLAVVITVLVVSIVYSVVEAKLHTQNATKRNLSKKRKAKQ